MEKVGSLTIDDAFISRLMLGTLSEHEQRMLAARLVRLDPAFRGALVSRLRPFHMFDLDLVAEYAAALERDEHPEQARREILARAYTRAPDLDLLIRNLTFGDVFRLGEVTRKIFTWTMAEFLLERSQRTAMSAYNAKTSLYLSSMVIDVVEILGAADHSPHFLVAIEDLRGRLHSASAPYSPLEKPLFSLPRPDEH